MTGSPRIVLSPDEGEKVKFGGLEMDMSSIPVLVERHGLASGESPA
jgi:hypothetical protein